MRNIYVVVMLVMLAACNSKYEDISRDARFADIAGKSFVMKQSVHAHGVSRSGTYAPPISYHLITRPPGFSGPEVLSKQKISEGTNLTVIALRRCLSCIRPLVEAEVTIPTWPTDVPVLIDVEILRDPTFTREADSP